MKLSNRLVLCCDVVNKFVDLNFLLINPCVSNLLISFCENTAHDTVTEQ